MATSMETTLETSVEPGVETSTAMAMDSLSMEDLSLLLFGHSAFQYLYAGCRLGVFSLLEEHKKCSRDFLDRSLKLPERSLRCLLFGLTSLRLIHKFEDSYKNAPIVTKLFENGEWQVFYDTVLLEAEVIYAGQSDFLASLQQDCNVGLRHIPGKGESLYHRLPQNPEMQKVFYNYMSSWSRFSCPSMLQSFDFTEVRRLLDVGGGDGTIAIAIAKAFPHIRISILELPGNHSVAQKSIAEAGVGDRVEVVEGSMFEGLPEGYDCVLFAHQLVIWSLETNTELLRKAYEMLPAGGRVLIFSSISSDTEDGPVMAALDSVYFISIPAPGGMIYAWKDYERCLHTAGFRDIQRHRASSWTPHGLMAASKLI
jgi:L-tyrosine C(3)-methyltransferase